MNLTCSTIKANRHQKVKSSMSCTCFSHTCLLVCFHTGDALTFILVIVKYWGVVLQTEMCVCSFTPFVEQKEHEKHGSSCVKVKRNVCKKKNHSLTQSSIYKTNDRKYSQAILVITSFFMQKMSINVSSLSKVEIFFRFYIKTKTFKDNVFNK